ncbi:glycosyltransferase [Spirosoma sp. HMF4905]|uniref:Glycosyltransferase n=1 Tax=Spirosoma arboris TaxID=2682092 RepID=A0A7K1S7L4_9BACT|nr:glycosyltransferase family 1 protein [Spirosoma arboris]MVM29566.1 glycosyltransferase [Spirosoma arboris]
MRIFFDHQTFSLQNYGGISRYFCELITGINKTSEHNAHLSLFWSNNTHLEEYNLKALSYPFKSKYSRLLHKSNQLYNYIDYKISPYDIYHTTYFDDFLSSRIGSNPFITTFYDMIYERLSHKFTELSNDKLIISQKKKIAQKASHLIAISESTKQDMIELMDIAPEKITVIHLGSSFSINTTNPINLLPSTKQPYLLYVGNRSGYKNFIPFLQSIAHLIIRHQIKLICAGGGNFTVGEKNIIRSLLIDNFIEYQPINDAILQNLYREATAFIFPSLYEGFGIPVLEAFSCDCPCVVSNTSSLPEVAGEAALYIDPSEPESMANAIENIILDNNLRNTLIKRGRRQLSNFSWANTVQETIALYSKLT